jgi:hypothetical protein
MQLADHLNVLLLDLLLILQLLLPSIDEPVVKEVGVAEDFRQEKVQETPKFVEVVLEGSTRQ